MRFLPETREVPLLPGPAERPPTPPSRVPVGFIDNMEGIRVTELTTPDGTTWIVPVFPQTLKEADLVVAVLGNPRLLQSWQRHCKDVLHRLAEEGFEIGATFVYTRPQPPIPPPAEDESPLIVDDDGRPISTVAYLRKVGVR